MESHLVGTHPGKGAECEIPCLGCQHPCRAHILGAACALCACKGYVRQRLDEDFDPITITGILFGSPDRFAETWLAVDAWKGQTYAHKELLVLAREDLPALGHPSVRPPAGLITRGDMLNYAIARTKTAYIAIWPDGYHPSDQLVRQMSAFSTNLDIDACLFHGTILARRWRLPTFPASDDISGVTQGISVTQIS